MLVRAILILHDGSVPEANLGPEGDRRDKEKRRQHTEYNDPRRSLDRSGGLRRAVVVTFAAGVGLLGSFGWLGRDHGPGGGSSLGRSRSGRRGIGRGSSRRCGRGGGFGRRSGRSSGFGRGSDFLGN